LFLRYLYSRFISEICSLAGTLPNNIQKHIFKQRRTVLQQKHNFSGSYTAQQDEETYVPAMWIGATAKEQVDLLPQGGCQRKKRFFSSTEKRDGLSVVHRPKFR
jgi:hypothetical protein